MARQHRPHGRAARAAASPRDFSQGDFNYDGTVNLQDFNLLAARFGGVAATGGGPGGAIRDASASEVDERAEWIDL